MRSMQGAVDDREAVRIALDDQERGRIPISELREQDPEYVRVPAAMDVADLLPGRGVPDARRVIVRISAQIQSERRVGRDDVMLRRIRKLEDLQVVRFVRIVPGKLDLAIPRQLALENLVGARDLVGQVPWTRLHDL